MLQRLKKTTAILLIIVLLPYIITIFMNGEHAQSTEKTDKRKELLKAHCIGILAKEVSSDYEDEMLKAQALLVRTTVYKQIEELGEAILEQEEFGDVSGIEGAWYRRLETLWEETEGEVILYDGKLALVPFHQISNGKTRNGKEALKGEEYPYLQVRECPKDVAAEHQMESKFIDVKGAKVTSVDSAGYVLTVTVGEETMTGESFRDAYGLASACFELQEFDANTRVTTKGVGHGLGLSQYTANEMAKEGQGYKEILQYFFAGTEVQEVAEILWNVE